MRIIVTTRMRGVTTRGSAAATASAYTALCVTLRRCSTAGAGAPRFHIDPRRLPSTIPGVSQEELAEKIAAYHEQQSTYADAQQAHAIAYETEAMKRSLSPEDFEAYVKETVIARARSAAEEEKMARMTPLQLHHYRLRQRRKRLAYEYYKTFMLLLVFFGSIFCIFYLFYFFE